MRRNLCIAQLVVALSLCDYVGSVLFGCEAAGTRIIAVADLGLPQAFAVEIASLVNEGTFHLEAYLLERGFQMQPDGYVTAISAHDLWHPVSEPITLNPGSVVAKNLTFERPTPTLHGTITVDPTGISCGAPPEDCVGSLRVLALPCLTCNPISHQTWESIDLSAGKTFDYYLLDMPSGPKYVYAWLYVDHQSPWARQSGDR